MASAEETRVVELHDRGAFALLGDFVVAAWLVFQAVRFGAVWAIAVTVALDALILVRAVRRWQEGMPVALTVGPEALAIASSHGRVTETWAWTEVERIERPVRFELKLHARDGRSVQVPLGRSDGTPNSAEAVADLIVERALAAGATTAPKLSARVRRRQRHNIPDGL